MQDIQNTCSILREKSHPVVDLYGEKQIIMINLDKHEFVTY